MKFQCPISTPEEKIEAVATYLPIIREIQSEDLKRKIAEVYVNIWQDCPWESPEDACFGIAFQQQKVINHIRVVTGSAYAAANLINEYQDLGMDLDTVLGLGLLHDVSKFLEFEPDGKGRAEYSEIGRNIQHGVAGAYYAKKAGFDAEWLQLIISHTPQSNNRPCKKEGFLFGLIDLADADQIAMAYDKTFPLFYDKV
jgi:putative nucleotidyltransferase with HDIG domain